MLKNQLFVLCGALSFTILFNTHIFGAALSKAVVYEEKAFALESGDIIASVVIVDLSNPEIKISASITGETITERNKLEDIVETQNPIMVIGTDSGSKGNFMSNGELIFSAISSNTSMGVTQKKEVIFAKPMIFTKLSTTDNSSKRTLSWTIRDINSTDQTGEQSVIYTPKFGKSLLITSSGWATLIEDSIIKSFFRVEPGRQVNIPPNGYIVYFSDKFANTTYFITPEIGRSISIEHTAHENNNEFILEEMTEIVSGNVRLVEKSEINQDIYPQNWERTSQTAVGVLPDGRLMFIYTPMTTTMELAQIMHISGCTDAITLSANNWSALYVNSNFITAQSMELPTVITINKIQQKSAE